MKTVPGSQLAEEFRRNPFGRHSPELRVLLNRLRSRQAQDPYVLLCTKPHREWLLARKSDARQSPAHVVTGKRFTSAEEAEWEVFKLLWQQHTGEDIQ